MKDPKDLYHFRIEPFKPIRATRTSQVLKDVDCLDCLRLMIVAGVRVPAQPG